MDNYKPVFLCISDCGGVRENGKYSVAGRAIVSEDLSDKTLDFKKDKSGLSILLNSEEVFKFPLDYYEKGFSIAYERIEQTKDGIGRRVILFEKVDPYEPDLPEPSRSIFRNKLDSNLIEIAFEGRIHLKFHSWFEKPNSKYWTVNNSYKKK